MTVQFCGLLFFSRSTNPRIVSPTDCRFSVKNNFYATSRRCETSVIRIMGTCHYTRNPSREFLKVTHIFITRIVRVCVVFSHSYYCCRLLIFSSGLGRLSFFFLSTMTRCHNVENYINICRKVVKRLFSTFRKKKKS